LAIIKRFCNDNTSSSDSEAQKSILIISGLEGKVKDGNYFSNAFLINVQAIQDLEGDRIDGKVGDIEWD
jgi:hypothetical protein